MNTELLLFNMFRPIKFSFPIRHYLWDTLSSLLKDERSNLPRHFEENNVNFINESRASCLESVPRWPK
jgi:hypothetical protein